MTLGTVSLSASVTFLFFLPLYYCISTSACLRIYLLNIQNQSPAPLNGLVFILTTYIQAIKWNLWNHVANKKKKKKKDVSYFTSVKPLNTVKHFSMSGVDMKLKERTAKSRSFLVPLVCRVNRWVSNSSTWSHTHAKLKVNFLVFFFFFFFP